MGYGIKIEAYTAERAILQNAATQPKQIGVHATTIWISFRQFPAAVDKLNLGERFHVPR